MLSPGSRSRGCIYRGKESIEAWPLQNPDDSYQLFAKPFRHKSSVFVLRSVEYGFKIRHFSISGHTLSVAPPDRFWRCASTISKIKSFSGSYGLPYVTPHGEMNFFHFIMRLHLSHIRGLNFSGGSGSTSSTMFSKVSAMNSRIFSIATEHFACKNPK